MLFPLIYGGWAVTAEFFAAIAIPIVTETPLAVGCKKKKNVFRAVKVTM